MCTVVAHMRHKFFDLFLKGNYSDEVLFSLIKNQSVDITAAQPSMKIKSDHGDTNKHIKITRPESGTYNKHLTGVFEQFLERCYIIWKIMQLLSVQHSGCKTLAT